METAARHTETLWLDLVRRLTSEIPEWYVWKNAESAFTGHGDIDSAAPKHTWQTIERVFREWAAVSGLRNVTACRHIPRTLNLVATGEGLPHLLQLEVKGMTTLRGAPLFEAEDLLPLTLIDPAGFRRLRPGAEGLLKFIFNGTLRGGEPNDAGLEAKNVMALLAEDPEGVREAARVFGRGEQPVLTAVKAAQDGGWDRDSVRRVERHAALGTFTRPDVLAERIWFRLARKPFCPLLKVVYQQDRGLPADLNGWLEQVRRTHAR